MDAVFTDMLDPLFRVPFLTGLTLSVAVAAFELWPALEFASATAELRTGVRQ